MSTPSTKILDHIIHLTPPGTVDQASQQFRDLGFNVIPGGTHTGGLSANALVILADGVYLELISFAHPASHYPPGSPGRQRRDANPWAHKSPGWIDFAFLAPAEPAPPGESTVASVINARAARDQSGIRYAPGTHGGRTRADGRVLRWVLTLPEDDQSRLRGSVPFYCGDATPREWRVPAEDEPPSNVLHPSGVLGIAHLRVLAEPESLAGVAAQLTSVVGDAPLSDRDAARPEYAWSLEVPSATSGTTPNPLLVLSAPSNDEERGHLATKGPGIFEVGFLVGPDGVERESATPHGKVVWLRSP